MGMMGMVGGILLAILLHHTLPVLTADCTVGKFGELCNGTCHCLDVEACDSDTGSCVGKCEKGYYPPPFCQQECPDGFYGLDCRAECHCLNDSVCEKVHGFCPGNLCHQDWISLGCSKRLPKLFSGPRVSVATCQYLTVEWDAWQSDRDFGDLPVAQYRLYSRLASNETWTLQTRKTETPGVVKFAFNVTGLLPDQFYVFRVDVHYSDDGKLVEKTSVGLESEPPTWVPCTTTTLPAPVTIPIIVGTDIFSTMTSNSLADNSILISWSVDPSLRRFSWNITLSYQLIGIGNCRVITDADVISVAVNASDTDFRLVQPDPWRLYTVKLSAQGTGVIAGANGTETITALSAEVSPSGSVRQLTALDVQATQVTVTWTAPPCEERGGVLIDYDVTVTHNVSGLTRVVTNNVTSVTVGGLSPYSSYRVVVRYGNSAGYGPPSQQLVFTTAEGVPAAVSIGSLVPTPDTVVVNVQEPVPVNGVLLEYYVQYSDTSSFITPLALSFNASLPGVPVIRRLTPATRYYVKVRARTGAGYGQYGGVKSVRTQSVRPFPPGSLVVTDVNSSCVSLAWAPPDQTSLTITGYRLTISYEGGSPTVVPLSASIISYTQCGLRSSLPHNVSLSSLSGAGASEGVLLEVTTHQNQPPAPPAPVLLGVSTTTALVQLLPVTWTDPGPLTAYQLEVERLTSPGGRRKRVAEVPGYVTAELPAENLTQVLQFEIGDGLEYGGYTNSPLVGGQQYRLHYVVISRLPSLTKFATTAMPTVISTPLPTSTTPNTSTTSTTLTPTTKPVVDEEDNDAVFTGVIIALVFVVLLIIFIIIFIIWWRRRQRLHKEPQANPDPLEKPQLAADRYRPEMYWSQIGVLTDSRHIVAGLECVPDDHQFQQVSFNGPRSEGRPLTFEQEFRSLPHTFAQASVTQAEQHPDRNRFPHLLAYDHSRVELVADSSSGCNYINASFMSGYNRQRAFIAAQSPYNDLTAVDFWRLIHQQQVKTVVMLANVVEDDIVKCTQFWPEQAGAVSIGQFYLEVVEETVYADFTLRDVRVRESDEGHNTMVRLMEFTAWPEHGVPEDPIPFLHFCYKVRQYHYEDAGPVLVHCGTGMARSGVFIAVNSLIEQYTTEGQISVFAFVRKMRKERPLMVRTLKQYLFIYECLLEEFLAGRTRLDTSCMRERYRYWTGRNAKTGRSFLRDQYELLHRYTRGPNSTQCSVALNPSNLLRNRYPHLVPADHHRPLLRAASTTDTASDYINAIFVDGYKSRRQFIVTQTPLSNSLEDFWQLLYEYRVTTVVSMDNYNNANPTCIHYWSPEVSRQHRGHFTVDVMSAFQKENVTIRDLRLRNSQRPGDHPHALRQFQFNAWAEDSVTPVSKTMVLDVLGLLMEFRANSPFPDSPVVVHCEDGATNSGLLVTLAVLCEIMEEEQELSVYHVIKHIKRRRPHIMKNYDQYRFCYKTLWDYINLRMPGGTFTDTLGQDKMDKEYGVASLSLTSYHDSLY